MAEYAVDTKSPHYQLGGARVIIHGLARSWKRALTDDRDRLLMEAVAESIRDALSYDKPKDWRENLRDSLEALETPREAPEWIVTGWREQWEQARGWLMDAGGSNIFQLEGFDDASDT